MHDVDAVAAAAAGGRDLASARHARRTPGPGQERMTEELLQERPGVRRARRTETAIQILKLHRRTLKLRMRPWRMPACFPVIGHANSVRFRVARSVFRHLAKKQQNRPVRAKRVLRMSTYDLNQIWHAASIDQDLLALMMA